MTCLVAVVACASCAASSTTEDGEPTATTSAAYAIRFAAPQVWASGKAYGAHGALVGDVDGDGRDDIVALRTTGITVRTSTGAGFATSKTWSSELLTGALLGDVDGDGRADLVVDGGVGISVMLSTGTRFRAPTQWGLPFAGENGTFLGDVDGDRRADLVAINESSVSVAFSTGTAFAQGATWWSAPFFGDRATLVGDVDGDGRADVVAVNTVGIDVILSNGSAFVNDQTWLDASFAGPYGTFLGDVDNDGKSDVVRLGNGTIGVIRSTGTAFDDRTKWSSVTFDEPHGAFLGDVNGDGNADLVGLEASDVSVMLAAGGGNQGGSGLGSHRPFPQFPDDGQIMQSPELVTILAEDDASTGSDSAANLNAFGQALADSAVWAAVSNEYGVGTMTAVANLVGPPMVSGSPWSITAIQSYVQGVVSGSGPSGPQPNGKRIYLLYLPAGATFKDHAECGNHFAYPGLPPGSTDSIAVVERCKPMGPEQTQLGELTNAASHEVVESATDPRMHGYNFNVNPAHGGSGITPGTSPVWEVLNGGDVEIADVCQGTSTLESLGTSSPPGGWEFQRMWSNAAAAAPGNQDPCMPATSQPYYSVNAAQDWYAVNPGQSVSIPIAGWSASLTGSWDLNRDFFTTASPTAFTIADFSIRSPLGLGNVPACAARQEMTAGTTANLEVAAPVSAQSGDYVILRLRSFMEDPATCNPDAGEDHWHFWPIGIYVP
ncbi:MAG TPA: VCBS repeat-containing protein [Polyangiaceae bacterium]|jgi:hypothetical protein